MKTYILLSLFALTILSIFACSSSEDKASRKFNESHQQEQSGQTDEALNGYRQLIAQFPNTRGANLALKQLELHQQKSRETAEQRAFEAIKSIIRVVEGYQSFYRRLPTSYKDFDNGEFFFDSAYMAQSIGEGYTVYVLLTGEELGLQLWTINNTTNKGYQLADNGKKVVETDIAKILKQVETNEKIEVQINHLYFLHL